MSTISIPIRLSGLFCHATSPAPTKPQPDEQREREPDLRRDVAVVALEQERGEADAERDREQPEAAEQPAVGPHRSASRASPDSSAFGMKPRAPLRNASEP